MASAEQAATIANEMSEVLSKRQGAIELARDYYEGRQKLRFASDQFCKYFADRYKGFSDNWTGIVADSPIERLVPVGIRPGGVTAGGDDDLWRVWLTNDADAESGLAFLDAVVARRSYGLVWGNDEDESTPQITFESTTEALVAYEPGSRRRVAGLKSWCDDEEEFGTLYLPGEVWKFRRKRVTEETLGPDGYPVYGNGTLPGGWLLRDVAGEQNPKPNPLGVVPLVEFTNRPLLSRDPISDISGVMAMQDAVNMLWSLLFTAADSASFIQRIIIGAERPKVPILDENGQKISERYVDLEKFAVDKVLWLEDPNTRIAEWTATNLELYTNVIEVAVGHIAAQTRTPQHYLIGKMANLSAEALKAAETGLVKKVEEKQLYFGRAIREMFRLVALAQGDQVKARAIAGGTVQWKDAESRSEAQLVDALLKLQTIGFPFEFLAERYGLTPTEVDRVMAMRTKALDRVMDDPAALVGPKPGQEGVDGPAELAG
jgi:hypothetical protein